MRTKIEILNAWKMEGGQLTTAWTRIGDLLIESIDHRAAEGNGDCSLIGYGYNKLLQADHKTMAAAVKNAALKCAGVVFKKDDDNPGKFIAKSATGELLAKYADGFAENMAILRKEGLRAFKPEKKESEGKSKVTLAVSALDKVNDLIAKGDKATIQALQSEMLILMAAFNRLCLVSGYGTPAALFAQFAMPTKGRNGSVRHAVAPTASEFEAAAAQVDHGGIDDDDTADSEIEEAMRATG